MAIYGAVDFDLRMINEWDVQIAQIVLDKITLEIFIEWKLKLFYFI